MAIARFFGDSTEIVTAFNSHLPLQAIQVLAVVQVTDANFKFDADSLQFEFLIPLSVLKYVDIARLERQFIYYWEREFNIQINLKRVSFDQVQYLCWKFTGSGSTFHAGTIETVIASSVFFCRDSSVWRNPPDKFPSFPMILSRVVYDRCIPKDFGPDYRRVLKFENYQGRIEELAASNLIPQILDWYTCPEFMNWIHRSHMSENQSL
jgi:hypothetical protein